MAKLFRYLFITFFILLMIVFIASPVLYFFYSFTEKDRIQYKQEILFDLKNAIGFDLAVVTDDSRHQYIVFKELVKGKAADASGIKEGDAIPVNSVDKFIEMLLLNQGKNIAFPIYRLGVKWDIQLKIPVVDDQLLYQGTFWSILNNIFSNETY